MDLIDAVAASAQPSSNLHQDSIVADIEGKLLCLHRKVKHKLTRLQGWPCPPTPLCFHLWLTQLRPPLRPHLQAVGYSVYIRSQSIQLTHM
jgi:hypothetical protein